MTRVSIEGEKFPIDGKPTYRGRTFRDYPIEGLLLNSWMIQATFARRQSGDAAEVGLPQYGCLGPGAERAGVFRGIAGLPRALAAGGDGEFSGGSPEGCSKEQPWDNTGFTAEGAFKLEYLDRMRWVLDRRAKSFEPETLRVSDYEIRFLPS